MEEFKFFKILYKLAFKSSLSNYLELKFNEDEKIRSGGFLKWFSFKNVLKLKLQQDGSRGSKVF